MTIAVISVNKRFFLNFSFLLSLWIGKRPVPPALPFGFAGNPLAYAPIRICFANSWKGLFQSAPASAGLALTMGTYHQFPSEIGLASRRRFLPLFPSLPLGFAGNPHGGPTINFLRKLG